MCKKALIFVSDWRAALIYNIWRRMYDVEHVEALGHDVVLVAVPLGCCPRAGGSASGTAFPACPSLGALLVAMDRESARHPRHALPIPNMLCPAALQACLTPFGYSMRGHARDKLINLAPPAS